MPIYEFHCQECGKNVELLLRSSDWKGQTCPSCGSSRLMKKLSVFAAKGDGDSGGSDGFPSCSGDPSSCGRCCGGGPHHH